MTRSADPLNGEVDTRPETSPYEDSTVKLQFKDGSTYTIPSPFLRKCPKLISLSHRSQTVPVDIHWNIGHTLVHYLFTDTYQCLKPKGPPHEKLTAEFATSVRVYVLARYLESSHLGELAQIEIQRLGDRLPFHTVVEQVRKAYPDISMDDGWFKSHLRARLKTAFQNPSELSSCGSANTSSQTLSVSDVLLECLVELVCDRAILLQNPTVASSVGPFTKEDPLEPDKSIRPATIDPASGVEVEPEKKDGDDPWVALDIGPEPNPEAEAEPERKDLEGIVTCKKKCKKCKKSKKCKHQKVQEPEPEPEPEPELRGEEDILEPKKKCKKTKISTHCQDLEFEHEPSQEAGVCTPPDVTTYTEQALLREVTEKDIEDAPVAIDDWLLCGSKS